jgi:PAS domain S-box-containing protein
VTHNADGEVVLVNAAACRMFGVDHEQMMGSAAQALLGDDRRPPTAGRATRPAPRWHGRMAASSRSRCPYPKSAKERTG